ncbi:MAG: transcriptional regulator [Blastocatellia bacterium]
MVRDGELVSLPPKAVLLLTTLLKHQGRAVEKEELMETIWPDMTVEDANLTQTVHILRKTLGKFPDSNITIETLPRFGYRLIAEVREHSGESEQPTTDPFPPVTFQSLEVKRPSWVSQTITRILQSSHKWLSLRLEKRLVGGE